MTTTKIDLTKAAELLGYERIEWDSDNDCYSGYGYKGGLDRSQDDAGGLFVAWNDDELRRLTEQAK